MCITMTGFWIISVLISRFAKFPVCSWAFCGQELSKLVRTSDMNVWILHKIVSSQPHLNYVRDCLSYAFTQGFSLGTFKSPLQTEKKCIKNNNTDGATEILLQKVSNVFVFVWSCLDTAVFERLLIPYKYAIVSLYHQKMPSINLGLHVFWVWKERLVTIHQPYGVWA